MRANPAHRSAIKAVVLLGPPGAGKSSAGAAAAAALGLPFVDLDDRIATLGQTSVDAVWRQGEPTFRALELKALAAALRERCILAAGAGVVQSARALLLLGRAPCVLLDVDDALGLSRIDGQRPWLLGVSDPAALYRARERARRPVRARLAVRAVSGAGALKDVTVTLADALRSLAGRPPKTKSPP